MMVVVIRGGRRAEHCLICSAERMRDDDDGDDDGDEKIGPLTNFPHHCDFFFEKIRAKRLKKGGIFERMTPAEDASM
jgi:hypothetical protein